MRLFELTGSSVLRNSPEAQKFSDLTSDSHGADGQHNFPTNRNRLEQFLSFLKERGYTPISNGGFGAVFTHPKLDYVIKVFKNDPAYKLFVKLCLQQQSNQHFPRFHGKIIKIDEATSVVRLELLAPLNQADAMAVACLDQFCHSTDTPKEFVSPRNFSSLPQYTACRKLTQQQPDLLDAMAIIRNYKPYRVMFDIHYGNFMRRGQTWVVTDPYYV